MARFDHYRGMVGAIRGWRVTLVAGLACLTLLAGCHDPLFPKNEPRSQYSRYEALRGRATPQKKTNALGREEPAVRERLQPLGEEY